MAIRVLRLRKTLEVEKQNHLPIVLSGVEAPYMQAWLKSAVLMPSC